MRYPSNCECECDNSCDICEYLDYENCKYRKKLVEQLVGECAEYIDSVSYAGSNSIECYSRENIHKCSSWILYIVLISIIFKINIGIAIYFAYYKYVNRNK